MSKILFIIKKRNTSYGISFGLKNSAEFVANSLIENGHEAKVVQVFDNSNIDKEVHDYKPTHVIIEALWVVPAKIRELLKLHKKVKWTVRIHSKTPFLSNEGIAFPWIKEYNLILEEFSNFKISSNNFEFNQDLSKVIGNESIYLPNIYLPTKRIKKVRKEDDVIKIGCFGSIRPMKNHLEQAIAAIIFAESQCKKLEFHVNSGLLEQRGEEVLKNLRGLFAINGHDLVEHEWMPHNDFVELVKTMDMGMQVSLSESFNIVTADFVANNIPMVVSTDVSWMPWNTRAVPTDTKDIVTSLKSAWLFPKLTWFNYRALVNHNKKAIKAWEVYV